MRSRIAVALPFTVRQRPSRADGVAIGTILTARWCGDIPETETRTPLIFEILASKTVMNPKGLTQLALALLVLIPFLSALHTVPVGEAVNIVDEENEEADDDGNVGDILERRKDPQDNQHKVI